MKLSYPVTLGDLERAGKLLWVDCRGVAARPTSKPALVGDLDPLSLPLPGETPSASA
jgi:hypothetical protein